jgi:hypothetical protein
MGDRAILGPVSVSEFITLFFNHNEHYVGDQRNATHTTKLRDALAVVEWDKLKGEDVWTTTVVRLPLSTVRFLLTLRVVAAHPRKARGPGRIHHPRHPHGLRHRQPHSSAPGRYTLQEEQGAGHHV